MIANMGHSAIAFCRRHWFVIGLLLVFFVLSIQYSRKVKALDNRSAFLRWRPQILSLEKGTNIYKAYGYPNPPIMALVLYPLASLPPLAGALVWFYLKVGMALAAFYWVFRLVENPEQPFPPWAKALTVVLSMRPIMGDLSHGNVNLFILFLVVAGLYAFRHGRDVLCGGLLGLAIACKITPLLFVPYLLWKRSWKTLAGCGVGLILFFGIVPGVFLGWGRNAELLHSWYAQMVKPFVIDGVNISKDGTRISELPNQSLPGLIYRLTAQNPSSYADAEHTIPHFDNVVTLDSRWGRLLLKGCMALFVVVVVWSCRTPLMPRYDWPLAAEFSIVLLGMLLFSERTWKHHCVTMVLPFAVLTYYLACEKGDLSVS